ncbi:MAG: hypothetical protein ACRD19_08550 [Terriglobia bacterium]
MYKEYPTVFDCPDDTEIVWRYMGLSYFLWMLKERKLYFSRLPEFKGDPYEGTLPHVNASQIHDDLKRAYGFASKLAAVSCWHMNDCESVAMWKLYVRGPEGVAIRSTVGRLKGLPERSDFVIGKVRYIDYETTTQPRIDPACSWLQPYMLIFQKRRSYKHEQEVRLVLLNPGEMRDPLAQVASERDAGAAGFGVPVSLADLIEKIIVSPEFPRCALSPLQQLVDAAGLEIKVEESDLLKPPSRECEDAFRELVKLAGSSPQ